MIWMPIRGVCAACRRDGMDPTHSSCGCDCENCHMQQTPTNYQCACTYTKNDEKCSHPQTLCDECNHGAGYYCCCNCEACDDEESKSNGVLTRLTVQGWVIVRICAIAVQAFMDRMVA